MGRFCEAKIDLLVDINENITNSNQKFKIIKDHSYECYKLEKINFENEEKINEWEEFKNKSINYLNNTQVEFNINLAIDNLKKIYDESKYDFIFDKVKMKKLIKNWQRNSIKFSMYTIFEKNNIYNNKGEIFLRDFRFFYNYEENKSEPVLNKYAIWMDTINISHIRKSKHLFIDGTWYRPSGFCQIIIILYKDIIINEKIPGCYIITNNKKYNIYKAALESFKNIITQNNIFDLNINSITVDDEIALNNAVNDVFPNSNKFNCYYHYKKNIVDNLRKHGFMRKKMKKNIKILKIL